jgi:NADH dehydrogenase FAD-containing subunit
VVLAYRGEVFNRIKPANRQRLEDAGAARQIDIRLQTEVKRVAEGSVELTSKDGVAMLENDVVVVQAGGVLPTALLHELGVTVETKYGTA